MSEKTQVTNQYGMLIDLNRCTGCNACIVACKQENDLPPRLNDLQGAKGFSFIRVECHGPEGEYPDLSMYYLPKLCMHCADPPCVEACSAEAIYKQTDGPVLFDKEKCIACEACLEACPYEAIFMDREQEVARKCTFCIHLIQQGKRPACAAACNAGAMLFGNVADPKSEISRTIKKHAGSCFVLKSELETGPSIHYIRCGEIR